MPEREPQRFVSEVKIYTQEGTITGGTIEVNRPMEIEGGKFINLVTMKQRDDGAISVSSSWFAIRGCRLFTQE